jgi:hypothetical protein
MASKNKKSIHKPLITRPVQSAALEDVLGCSIVTVSIVYNVLGFYVKMCLLLMM